MTDYEWWQVYDRIVPNLENLDEVSDDWLDAKLDYAANNVGLLTVQSIMAPELLTPRLARWTKIHAALVAEKERRA